MADEVRLILEEWKQSWLVTRLAEYTIHKLDVGWHIEVSVKYRVTGVYDIEVDVRAKTEMTDTTAASMHQLKRMLAEVDRLAQRDAEQQSGRLPR